MSKLLDLTLQAAGGLERWRGVKSLGGTGCINSRGTQRYHEDRRPRSDY